MSEKTLKFDNIEVNKTEFHESKQPIDLNLVDTDKIVISDKFKRSDDGFKCFIGYKEDDIINPLCIILTQMSGYLKHFEKSEKTMSFMIENDIVLVKNNKNWNEIKNKLGINFHSQPIYDEKYIKTKLKEFSDVVNTNFF